MRLENSCRNELIINRSTQVRLRIKGEYITSTQHYLAPKLSSGKLKAEIAKLLKYSKERGEIVVKQAVKYYLYSLDLGPKCIQSSFNMLIPSVYLVDIMNPTCPFSRHGSHK